MFGLGMMEILMILAIALIVVGPQKLPELAKTLGKAMGEFKRSAADLKRSMDVETTIKDIDIPKTDLKEILNESPKESSSNSHSEPQTESQPDPYATDKDDDPDSKTTDTISQDSSSENDGNQENTDGADSKSGHKDARPFSTEDAIADDADPKTDPPQ